MQDRFEQILFNELLVKKTDRVLCAISGGADSTVLMRLLKAAQIDVIAAHCNFQLRGSESDDDQEFVQNLCHELAIPFFSKTFDTKTYCEEHKLGTQEAARNLRYTWFQELAVEQNCNLIATAHNQTDSMETVLINQIRGTGIEGLKGIPVKTGRYIRPLVAFTSNEIRDFAKLSGWDFRTDSSNASDAYLRNKIRHQLLPSFYSIEPDIENRFNQNSIRIDQANQLLEHFISHFESSLNTTDGFEKRLPIDTILTYPQSTYLLYRIVSKFGFNYDQCEDLINSKQVGACIYSKTHRILRDREEWLISELSSNTMSPVVFISSPGVYAFNTYQIVVTEVEGTMVDFTLGNQTCYINPSDVTGNLQLRCWTEGDRIYPLGMKGSKLVSDVFIDHKLDNHTKSNLPLLCDDGNIIWICGIKFSEKYKINPSSNATFWKIQLEN